MTEDQIGAKTTRTWNVPRSNLVISQIHKNIVRYTAHTIVSWPNPKQWLMIHTSGLMMIIRQSTHSHDHHRRNGGGGGGDCPPLEDQWVIHKGSWCLLEGEGHNEPASLLTTWPEGYPYDWVVMVLALCIAGWNTLMVLNSLPFLPIAVH